MNIGAPELLILLTFWGMFGFVGWLIGQGKARGGEGVALGLFLGVIGWVIVGVMRPTPRAQAEHELRVERVKQQLRQQHP